MRKPAVVASRPADTIHFGEDEEDLIIKLHALLGNRWSLIAGRLPGRREKQVKKYWNKHLKRKLLRMGIDPDNHRATALPPPPAALHTSPPHYHSQDLNLDLTITPPPTTKTISITTNKFST